MSLCRQIIGFGMLFIGLLRKLGLLKGRNRTTTGNKRTIE